MTPTVYLTGSVIVALGSVLAALIQAKWRK